MGNHKILIATLYNVDPVLVAANKLGPSRMYLLIDKVPSKEQEKSLELLKNSLGRVIDIKVVKTEVYDIVAIATKAVEIIDMQPKDDQIFVNITSGRKTKAIGLLFGAYARPSRVKKILYYPEEKGELPVFLPKLQFQLNESQKKVLEYLEEKKFTSLMVLSEKIDISRAMLYRNIKELEEMGLVEDLKLTDAGKIARL
ncbi:CRISPR locus-related DNA-binding protein [Candidatus Woesearchaeota archaeon]|jgi:CRISPR locus-related DNA-binding protein|nr:CRISPR locus-related DNA-binding protein [Candidatus Woesearchaeota archaeon]